MRKWEFCRPHIEEVSGPDLEQQFYSFSCLSAFSTCCSFRTLAKSNVGPFSFSVVQRIGELKAAQGVGYLGSSLLRIHAIQGYLPHMAMHLCLQD